MTLVFNAMVANHCIGRKIHCPGLILPNQVPPRPPAAPKPDRLGGVGLRLPHPLYDPLHDPPRQLEAFLFHPAPALPGGDLQVMMVTMVAMVVMIMRFW